MKTSVKNVDWSKKPSIRIEKVLCPICSKPTGPDSNCYSMEIDRDSKNQNQEEEKFMLKTIEINGEMCPIMSPQCYYRANNDYYGYVNYPISAPLIDQLSSIDGLEKIIVKSAYKFRFTIADQFRDALILDAVKKEFHDVINEGKSLG
tara:strand:- start:213 stop:656 length:444 start_codon:yes stop_codon:yes gene_type:complete